MKVIFLDIDGVLNTYFTKSRVAHYVFVDDHLVERLQAMVQVTGAKLVLSSTWRSGWDMLQHPDQYDQLNEADMELYQALVEKLAEYDLQLLDYTPLLDKPRGEEIEAWLQTWQGEPVERFVILDDLGGKQLRPHSRQLIQIGPVDGLKEKHVKLVIDRLTRGGSDVW